MAGYRLAPRAARARRNPWQRRRLAFGVGVTTPTKTFTADAVIVDPQRTKTFTADAIIKAVSTQTFTADAIIAVRYEGVAQYPLYGMWAPATQTKTFTADALIVSGVATTRTATFTADAVIVDPQRTKTFTADAIIKAVGTQTFTADAIIAAALTPTTRTKTFTADAVIAASASTGSRFLWFRRMRRNMSEIVKTYVQLLDGSTARTSTYTAPTKEAKMEAGILVIVNVTAASGTGGLTVGINAVDQSSTGTVQLNTTPSAITSTGTYSYALYPFGAVSGNVTQATAFYLPRLFSIKVTHGDSSSYTYSLGYCLLP